MEVASKIYKQNFVHMLFYGYVLGRRQQGDLRGVFSIACDFCTEVDDTLAEETLYRHWYVTQEGIIRSKKTKNNDQEQGSHFNR